MSQDSEEVIDLKEEVALIEEKLSDAQEERDDYKALFQSKMIRVSNLEAHLSGANGEKELQKNEIGRLNTKIKSLENKLSETEQDRDLFIRATWIILAANSMLTGQRLRQKVVTKTAPSRKARSFNGFYRKIHPTKCVFELPGARISLLQAG